VRALIEVFDVLEGSTDRWTASLSRESAPNLLKLVQCVPYTLRFDVQCHRWKSFQCDGKRLDWWTKSPIRWQCQKRTENILQSELQAKTVVMASKNLIKTVQSDPHYKRHTRPVYLWPVNYCTYIHTYIYWQQRADWTLTCCN